MIVSYFLLQKLSENDVLPVPLFPKSNKFKYIYLKIQLLSSVAICCVPASPLFVILSLYSSAISMVLCHWFAHILTHRCSLIMIRAVTFRNSVCYPTFKKSFTIFFFLFAKNWVSNLLYLAFSFYFFSPSVLIHSFLSYSRMSQRLKVFTPSWLRTDFWYSSMSAEIYLLQIVNWWDQLVFFLCKNGWKP